MITRYHVEITKKALGEIFSKEVLKTIIYANVKQDRLENTFGHDYIHFDGSSFQDGFKYILDQEQQVADNLKIGAYKKAQMAFGRITHSWQDLYSHSNYVNLWSQENPDHLPEGIIVNDQKFFAHPDFTSGKNYGVIEFIAMVPLLTWFVSPFMPADSHAKMNLDSPASGPMFSYAYWAAFYATRIAYEQLISKLLSLGMSPEVILFFNEKTK